jgi:gamma-glutamyltranspeptidase/glutathione hydrolase
MERGGGLIGKADLAGYAPIWREPVTFTYRGYTVHSMPLSSSGGITLALILNMLEGWDTLPPPASAQHVHLLTEIMRRAFTDRNEYLGDPAFVEVPVERLASQAYADERRADIAEAHASPSSALRPGLREGTETTHYSVVDAEGNAVAVTTTINSGFGSGVTVSGAGFLLNNEMDDFTAAPGEPNIYGLVQGAANAIAPGKRMLSAMSPTLVLDPDGRLCMVLGSPGGPTIITTVAQVISYVVDHGLTLAEAVAAPRVHHQGLPDSLRYERRGLQGFTLRQLERMGHRPDERRGYSGDVAAVMRAPAGGWLGVADPRRGGGAAGY